MKTLIFHLSGRCFFSIAMAVLILPLPLRAELPEPDNLLYGAAYLGTNLVTAAKSSVVIEARRTPSGAALASYRMGSSPAAGNLYSLRISLESGGPVLAAGAAQSGELVYLTLTESGLVREQKTFVLGPRGSVNRIDFGSVDTDGDGLPDSWEQQYFGNLNSDANADPDHDGLTNAQELAGNTQPLVGDSRHPADSNPTNSSISIVEVVAYSLAWKTGAAWPIAPTNIPVTYVSRAGALWKGGENYRFDGTVASAPLWWINVLDGGGGGGIESDASLAGSHDNVVICSMPAAYLPGTSFVVTNNVTPQPAVSAYAVEDQVPAGWDVTAVSHGGAFDAVQGMVRWGLFFDQAPRALSYQVRPPSTARGPAQFRGEAAFDGASVTISGTRESVFLPLPHLTSVSLVAERGLRFVLRGLPGQSLSLESSTDLDNWEEVTVLTIDLTGQQEFYDPHPAGPWKFYRARPISP